MDKPKIGCLYKDMEYADYFVITSLSNTDSSEKMEIRYITPGSPGYEFSKKGLAEISDFLHSIELVQSVGSELERLAKMEGDLINQLCGLKDKKMFLRKNSKSQQH